MRQNPYLKDEQEFRPLLMRGSLQNNFLITSLQMKQEIERLTSSTKETYTLNGISFDMVRPPSLGVNGTMPPTRNVEMCTTECTQELFEEVMSFNYSGFRGEDYSDSATRPVENVSWFDCIVFCNKLSDVFGYAPYYEVVIIRTSDSGFTIHDAKVDIIGGNGFRLPTDEEWLAFAKAGAENVWSGNNIQKEVGEELGDYAWSWENSNHQTHPAATKKPNEWGMYDMLGNVDEWVWDKWSITDTRTSAFRVSRGGSWDTGASFLRSAHRNYNSPSSRYNTLGFRFARTIE
jgi:formylglycine-generating enzyme required for sulfatase activity